MVKIRLYDTYIEVSTKSMYVKGGGEMKDLHAPE